MGIKNNFTVDQKKILFLWLDDRLFQALNARRRGMRTGRLYKNVSLAMKLFRKLHIIFGLPGFSMWFDNWKFSINSYDTIIIQDSTLIEPVVRYIRKKNKNIRIIVWYWNPVAKSINPGRFVDCNVEIWSFDEDDCKKHNLMYNTQYYFNDVEINTSEIKQDVFFVGGDKGRIEDLIKFQKIISQIHISSYFHITSGAGSFHGALFSKNKKFSDYYKQKISYDEVLEYIGKSKAILDYVSEGQTGLTIRPLEALFFRKKLITNDVSIIDRDFYERKNIFVIGKDDINELPLFLSEPFMDVEKNIRDKYDFKEWMERFFEGVNEKK